MVDAPTEELSVRLDWTFAAESYLDQLSPEERSKVLHAVEQLPTAWDSLETSRLQQVKCPIRDMRVGAVLRVLVVRQGNVIMVVDVVRRSQVEGLRSRLRQAASTG